MQEYARPLALGVGLLTLGCDSMGERAGRAVEQRLQQAADKLATRAIDSVDTTLGAVGARLSGEGGPATATVDGELRNAGLAPTTVTLKASPEPVAAVYLGFDRAFEGILEVRCLDGAGAEIGRARQKVSAPAGAGQFVEFPLDPRTRLGDIRTLRLRRP